MSTPNLRDVPERVLCLIVGGGMSGVSMGAKLISGGILKHHEFCIVDQQADYGGVWEANTYPGAACDVPSHAYAMRYSLKAGETPNNSRPID